MSGGVDYHDGKERKHCQFSHHELDTDTGRPNNTYPRYVAVYFIRGARRRVDINGSGYRVYGSGYGAGSETKTRLTLAESANRPMSEGVCLSLVVVRYLSLWFESVVRVYCTRVCSVTERNSFNAFLVHFVLVWPQL